LNSRGYLSGHRGENPVHSLCFCFDEKQQDRPILPWWFWFLSSDSPI